MKSSLINGLVCLALLSSVVAACQPSAPAAPSAELEPAASEPIVLRVATDATFPPFEMVDESSKELTGYDIELMKAVAEKANFKLEFANVVFDSMLAGISECQYDVSIAAITITEDRKKTMSFSDPYISAGQIIIANSEDDSITGVESLVGKTVGAQLGTTGLIEAQNIEGVNAKSYDAYEMAVIDVANGQIDAVLADYPTAKAYVAKNPDHLKLVGEPFTNESYGIVVCPKRADLLEPINAALKELQADGTMQQLEDKWISGK